MSKSKSITVTVLCAVMLAVIIAGMYLLHLKAWMILAGLLGVYGYVSCASAFCRWLRQEEPEHSTPILPCAVKRREEEPEEEVIDTMAYDDILAEMREAKV